MHISFQLKDSVGKEKNEKEQPFMLCMERPQHTCWQKKKPVSRKSLGVRRVQKGTGKFSLEESVCLDRWMGLEWRKCILSANGTIFPGKWWIHQHWILLSLCWTILSRLCFAEKGWTRLSLWFLQTWYPLILWFLVSTVKSKEERGWRREGSKA